MNSFIRTLKDKIPHRLKVGYYNRKREEMRKEAGSLEHISRVLNSLDTVPFDAYMRSKLSSQTEVTELPKLVGEIEINDSCNIDCVMCKTSMAKRKKGLMDLDLFERTVAMLAERGMKNVTLHTIGDPLANRNLAKYLAVLRRHNVTVGDLSSNCQLLDRHLDTLFEYRDVIYTFRPSIDAASKEIYERIRFGGKWEVLHTALRRFAERNAKATLPFPITVNNIISKDNFHEIAYIPEVFSYLTAPTDFRYAFINSLAPSNEFFLNQNYFDSYHQNAPCHTIWNSVYVLKDGSLTTCCRDYHGDLVFGNVVKDDLATAYNNSTVQKIRRAHLDGNTQAMPDLCRECFMVDPRLSEVINGVFQYFFRYVKAPASELQRALFDIGPKLKSRDFGGVIDRLTQL